MFLFLEWVHKKVVEKDNASQPHDWIILQIDTEEDGSPNLPIPFAAPSLVTDLTDEASEDTSGSALPIHAPSPAHMSVEVINMKLNAQQAVPKSGLKEGSHHQATENLDRLPQGSQSSLSARFT